MGVDEFRFIDLETHSASENMAIDEAILLSMKKGLVPPTLRLYRWNPSAVSIGTFQSMEDEVDLSYCREHGIDYIRRITGGGAVFHFYEGEITYSILIPRDHRLAPRDIIKSYELLCQGLIHGLAHLGIKSEFKPINDIIAGGKKISGNAQTRRHMCLLQHGTILLNLDVKEMFSILKVPEEKISDKMISDVKERVTSITDLLGYIVPFDELRIALIEGFTEALDIELVPGDLSESELTRMNELIITKYGSDDWNLSR